LIRTGRNPKVIPTIGPVQGPEFTQLSVWFQLEFDLSVSVKVEDTYPERRFGAIVDPKDNAVTINIEGDTAHEVGLAICDTSFEDAEKRVRTEDGEMINRSAH
jgi:hypothetical protein